MIFDLSFMTVASVAAVIAIIIVGTILRWW